MIISGRKFLEVGKFLDQLSLQNLTKWLNIRMEVGNHLSNRYFSTALYLYAHRIGFPIHFFFYYTLTHLHTQFFLYKQFRISIQVAYILVQELGWLNGCLNFIYFSNSFWLILNFLFFSFSYFFELLKLDLVKLLKDLVKFKYL